MYYEITPYVLAHAALAVVALLIFSLYLLKLTKILKTNQALLYIVAAIMLSVSVLISLEVILHLAIQKHPARWAFFASLVSYLITTASFLFKLKIKFSLCSAYISVGALVFLASCLPIYLWLGCATGPVCI